MTRAIMVLSLCALCATVWAQDAPDVLVFEAEDVSQPEDAWGEDIRPVDKWNLWSRDQDADKKWSGGVVLQSPPVLEDRERPEDGAPVLHTRLTDIPEGRWTVSIKFGRELAVSLDGEEWRRLSELGGVLGTFDVTDGTLEFWVDDRFAHAANPGFSYYDTVTLTRALPEQNGVVNGGFEAGRAIEHSGWMWWSRDGVGGAEFSTEAREGERSVKLEHDGQRDWAFTNRGRLDVEPGQVWTAEAWVKCEGTDNITLNIVALSGGQLLRWSIASHGAYGTVDWTHLQASATIPADCDEVYVRFTGSGKTLAWVDGVLLREGMAERTTPPKPKVEGWAFNLDRVEERLDRGVVAMPQEGGRVYVQWRLLKDDPEDVAFNVYRATGRGRGAQINDEPISRTTDFMDENPHPTLDNRYWVRPVVGGRELEPSEQAYIDAEPEVQPYLSVKLNDPETTFQKVGLADLNGDGKYDFVIKTPNSNIDPWHAYWRPSETTYRLEAYLSDGAFLWSKDLGWNIEAGIWYSPYIVFDFDGDGRAEVAVKTAPTDVDYRDTEPDGQYPAGRVREGAEYLSILDGMTGEEKARVDWPDRDGFGGGDAGYNYASRNQMGIAYLDGKTPCLLVARGTYTTMKLVAYQYHNGALEELWRWDSRDEPGGMYRGQGAHFMHSADVDGDGRDEVLLGSCVIDDNGDGLWSTGLGHPDHFYVGNIDPTRPGLEIYYGIEARQPLRNGVCLVDAATGEIIWGLDIPTHHVHGAGLCSDIDPLHVGQECYSGEHPDAPRSFARWLHSAQGELIADETAWDVGLSPRAVYWDETPQRALLRGSRLFKYPDQTISNYVQGSQIAWVDMLGDWREEIITSVAGELRIYVTPIPARDRRVTLMQDPLYRSDVAHLAMGYAQPPMTSFYIGQQEPVMGLRPTVTRAAAGETVTGRLIIVGGQEEGIEGAARLAASGGAQVTPATAELAVGPGERAEVEFTLTMPAQANVLQGLLTVDISATLEGTHGELSTMTAVNMLDLPIEGAARVQAHEFSAQEGGEVQVRDDKVGDVDRSISHWDDAGHRLEYTLQVPQAGRYMLALRYCTPSAVEREVQVNQGAPFRQEFAATGGFSSGSNDWAHALMQRPGDEGPLVLELSAGEVTVRMTNADGRGMNLDYVVLVPGG